jgi:hypothetical protein
LDWMPRGIDTRCILSERDSTCRHPSLYFSEQLLPRLSSLENDQTWNLVPRWIPSHSFLSQLRCFLCFLCLRRCIRSLHLDHSASERHERSLDRNQPSYIKKDEIELKNARLGSFQYSMEIVRDFAARPRHCEWLTMLLLGCPGLFCITFSGLSCRRCFGDGNDVDNLCAIDGVSRTG